MTIKLDTDSLRYIAALENATGSEVMDCVVENDTILYIVKNGQIGMAIGKGGENAKKIGNALGKRIKIVELTPNPVKFTNNILKNIAVKNINLEEKDGNQKIIIEADFRTKGIILGKGGKKIQILKDLLKRHHNIQDVIVK